MDEPLTLFDILGVSYGASEDEVQAAYDNKRFRFMRQQMSVPVAVEAAFKILSNPQANKYYVYLLEARRKNTPVLTKIEDLPGLGAFCKMALLHAWEYPAGFVGPDGYIASLGEVYIGIRLLGEPPPWGLPKPAAWFSRHVYLTAGLILFVFLNGSFLWWYHYDYHSAERLQEKIRADDVEVNGLIDSVRTQETEFQSEVLAVVGPMPTDGTMPDDLARVCFQEKKAAIAWDEVRDRQTVPAAVNPLDDSKKSVEQRIGMGTFIEADEKTLSDVKASLNKKGASFSELKRDLDLLRVLLEAERLSHAGANASS